MFILNRRIEHTEQSLQALYSRTIFSVWSAFSEMCIMESYKFDLLLYIFLHLSAFVCCSCVSAEGMKMRGMKNETNGTAKANKVVSDGEMLSAQRDNFHANSRHF